MLGLNLFFLLLTILEASKLEDKVTKILDGSRSMIPYAIIVSETFEKTVKVEAQTSTTTQKGESNHNNPKPKCVCGKGMKIEKPDDFKYEVVENGPTTDNTKKAVAILYFEGLQLAFEKVQEKFKDEDKTCCSSKQTTDEYDNCYIPLEKVAFKLSLEYKEADNGEINGLQCSLTRDNNNLEPNYGNSNCNTKSGFSLLQSLIKEEKALYEERFQEDFFKSFGDRIVNVCKIE
jgi:hypothetical protein